MFYDPDTGQPLSVTVSRDKGVKYRFEDGFVILGIRAAEILRDAKIPRDGHTVMFWFWTRLEYRNTVTDFTYKSIGEDCHIADPSRVGKLIKILESYNLLRRGKSRGLAFLNPHYCFRGSPTEQMRAIEMWDKMTATTTPGPVIEFGVIEAEFDGHRSA